jgi:signal recognition particle subunit SRP19
MGKKKGAFRVKQVGPKVGNALNPLADLMIPPEEMITLPPKPDPKTMHFWPLHETFSMKYDNFCVLWPTYMDSTKTVANGRRLSKDDSVKEPSVYEISEALQSLQIRHVIQPYKGYPRDVESRWDNPGRVLVDMDGYRQKQQTNDDDVPEIMEFDADTDDLSNIKMEEQESSSNNNSGVTKLTLMRELTKRIPHTQARIKRLEEKERELRLEKQKEIESKRTSAATNKAKSNTGGGSNKSKKKGKKKR